jgi:4-amino-4-deoxy-L-arabinose transferase-like glycosyltransferase
MDARRDLNPAGDASSGIRAWWRDWQFAVLLVFVLLTYFTRLAELSIRGEESRRGLVAREMLETGDWIIPRTQGVPLFSRPPLQNWMIAGLSMLRGDVDAVAMRLPSVCAILLTCVVIYRYSRLFLSPLGALAAGLAFASMGQVLELGRVGETDALFTLFVSGALLAWHGGIVRGSPPLRVWCAAYALSALGTLTKGPQAPVYFLGPVCVYLLCRRDWRMMFNRAHLAGIATFILLLGTWQVPCLYKVGLDGIRKMYITDVGHRFLDANWFSFGEHLAVYPLELLTCLLPWSALMIVWCNRDFRRSLCPARDHVLFLATCLAVAFPTVWFPPGSRPRYFMSLYPCVAILAGLAVERVSRALPHEPWRVVWPIFVRASAMGMVAAGLAFLAISVVDFQLWLAQPLAIAVSYAAAGATLAWLAWRSIDWGPERGPFVAVLAIAAFVGLTHCTVMINSLRDASVDIVGSIEKLKQQLPPGTKLVSFNVTHHLFVFHYRDEVPVVDWPERADEESGRVPYFAIDVRELETKALPFPWETFTAICCDRHKMPEQRIKVLIGHRLDLPQPDQTAQRSTPDSPGHAPR